MINSSIDDLPKFSEKRFSRELLILYAGGDREREYRPPLKHPFVFALENSFAKILANRNLLYRAKMR
jgi:hypothetical protein